MTAARRFIAYYRVSTDKQGQSGLGLEAQRKTVTDYLNGGAWALIGEFTEVESGKRNDNRPVLAKALAACRAHGATLVIAKLDRLARNVAFISNLMESSVEFVAVDFPAANRLTIHILAAVAEHEAQAISDRTRAALAAATARGVRLGGFRGRAGTCTDLARARASRIANSNQRVRDLMPVIHALKAEGHRSLRSIATGLNQRSIPAPRGGIWSAAQVQRILSRNEIAKL